MAFDPSMASIAEIGISIKRAGLSPAPGPVKPAHASSGFRFQMSFRAVFGWGCNGYAFIKLSVRPSLICWANQRFRTSIPMRHHSLLCGDAAPSVTSLAPPYSQRLQINTPLLPP